MLEKIASKLCEGIDDEILQAKVLYGLRIVSSEVLKFILLLLIFTIFHKVTYYFFSLAIFFTIRSLTGGIHLDTSLKCFLLSVAFFIATVFSSYIPKPNYYCYILIAIISIFIIGAKSPIASNNRPLKNSKQRKRLKLMSVMITLLWLIFLLVYIKNIYLLNCGIITIFLLSIQLINKKKEV